MNSKTFFQNLLLFLGAFIVAALLAEIILRILLPSPIVWKYPQEQYIFDPDIGLRLKQNQHAFTHDKLVSINSQGIRDTEYNDEPAAHVTRILALGDSQTFGNGIKQSDTWPKQLEHKLNNQADSAEYEVLNGGLPGSDTWQHEILLQRLAATYRPDIVVLAFYVNDVQSKPASIMATPGDNTGSVDRRLVYQLKRSALLLTLINAYDAFSQVISPSRGFQLEGNLLAGESNPLIDKRWEQVRQSLLNMKKVTADNSVEFFVVSLPRRDQVDGRLQAEKYNERLSEVMKFSGVRFINMLGPLQQAYKEYGKALFIPWDGHNTKITNRIIAEEVAAAVQNPGSISVDGAELSGFHSAGGRL